MLQVAGVSWCKNDSLNLYHFASRNVDHNLHLENWKNVSHLPSPQLKDVYWCANAIRNFKIAAESEFCSLVSLIMFFCSSQIRICVRRFELCVLKKVEYSESIASLLAKLNRMKYFKEVLWENQNLVFYVI